jgi:hypothetical protein
MSMSLESLEPIYFSTEPSRSKLRMMLDRIVAAREAGVRRRARIYLPD